jgi:hypothetical protein
MNNTNNTENDDCYDEWGTDNHVEKCNDCDFTGTISTLDRITCSKFCGYSTYECDDCGWKEKNKNIIIENKLESIHLKEHIKYILYMNGQNGIEETIIWICNHCQKNDDEEKLITNMETLVNSNCGGRGNSCYLDRTGSQVHPPLKEDDLEYILKKIFQEI